jgi:hypothetical protein
MIEVQFNQKSGKPFCCKRYEVLKKLLELNCRSLDKIRSSAFIYQRSEPLQRRCRRVFLVRSTHAIKYTQSYLSYSMHKGKLFQKAIVRVYCNTLAGTCCCSIWRTAAAIASAS